MPLSPQQLHALAKCGKQAEKVRDELKAGHTYRIDFVVRVKGNLSVGERQPTTFSNSVDPAQLLAAVLEQLGPRKRVSVVSAIIAAKGMPDVSEEATKQAERLIRETTTSTAGKKRGNVTGKLTAELVETPELAEVE